MTNYGFLIDQRKCIGCHACSTACKMENEVPLGVYRTWVKYVEVGAFPDTRRHFQVTRCNHCANPPCVRICPVTAMYQRDDGIVEFDPEVCIGCKACLQACPYDAIYIDPETHSAAKCHYCSHRVEVGLEPACVIVCPEEAIISGDLDDPHSNISRLVAQEPVSVRKPEQGTAPKLFYIDATGYTLNPTATHSPTTYSWADVVSDQAKAMATVPPAPSRTTVREPGENLTAPSGVPIRVPRQQAMGYDQNVLFARGKPAEQMVQVAYNAQHKLPWHWQVPAYLVTKGIGSGIYICLALIMILGLADLSAPLVATTLVLSLLFTGLTTVLLVMDLEKPGTFLRILTRPQWRSWLTRGAFVLIGFSTVGALWLLAELGGALNVFPGSGLLVARQFWAWVGLPLAVLSAIYTAFLFAQAEGRDLWQSPLLPVHLLIQALMVGSGVLLLVAGVSSLLVPVDSALITFAGWTFFAALVIDLFVTLVGEFGIPHASENAARAAHAISHGKYRRWFWDGNLLLGHAVPLLLLALGGTSLLFITGAVIAAVIGLYAYEYAFVMAPQEVPNS